MGISALAGVTIGRVIHVKKNEVNPLKKIVTLSTGRYSAGLIGIGLETIFYTRDENQQFHEAPQKELKTVADFFGKVCSRLDKIFDKEQNIPPSLKS